MDNDAQKTADSSEPTLRPPDTLIAESRATFAHSREGAGGADAAARSEGRSAVPSESSAEAFSFHVHTYVSEHIRFADQKAGLVFAVTAGLLCYVFKNDVHKMWLKALSTWTAIDFLCFMAVGSLACGLAFSCWVIIPMLRRTHRGFVFFNSIAEFDSSGTFASEILSNPSTNLTRAILQHTYDLARVCRMKYRKLTVAVWLASVGVLLSVLVLLLKP